MRRRGFEGRRPSGAPGAVPSLGRGTAANSDSAAKSLAFQNVQRMRRFTFSYAGQITLDLPGKHTRSHFNHFWRLAGFSNLLTLGHRDRQIPSVRFVWSPSPYVLGQLFRFASTLSIFITRRQRGFASAADDDTQKKFAQLKKPPRR